MAICAQNIIQLFRSQEKNLFATSPFKSLAIFCGCTPGLCRAWLETLRIRLISSVVPSEAVPVKISTGPADRDIT